MVSLLLSHMQHQFTTTTCLFLKLSKVKIFPNDAVHTKNATLEKALILQMLFQGNGEPAGVQSRW
jgi:hypothetical protein